MIRPGPFRIPHSLLRAFACNSLTANLGREHVLGRLPGGPCDRKKAFLHQGQASEDKRKQKHEISTRSHDAPRGMAEIIVGAFSFGCAQKAAVQTKRALLPAIFGESILCGYAKTAGERNQQVWRSRHSLPGNSGRPWGLPFLHRRTVAVPRYAYSRLSHRVPGLFLVARGWWARKNKRGGKMQCLRSGLEPSFSRRYLSIAVLAALFALPNQVARADEGGVSFWVPGLTFNASPAAPTPPTAPSRPRFTK